jgi:hypothetical protein
MRKVLFISGNSMGDALGGSGRELRATFEALDLEFVEIKLAAPNAFDLLNKTVAGGSIEFAFSHVGVGMDLSAKTSDNREVNFWAATGTPFISFYGDSPAYFFDRHVLPGPGFAGLYAFPEHLRFRQSLPLRNGMLGSTPLRMSDATPKRSVDLNAKHSGKLLFLKNGNDPKRLTEIWRDGLPPPTFVMLADLAGELAGQIGSRSEWDLDAEVCAYFNGNGLDVEQSTALRLFFVAQLDDYLRRIKSTFIGETLREFPVQILGHNWEHVDFSRGACTQVQGADYAESSRLIRNSLAIVDMSPNTSLGPHDRPLRAFGLYTLCLTNEQQFFTDNFQQHADFTYRFDRDSLRSIVADTLSHRKRAVELGVEVAETFRNRFDQGAFGRTVLDVASALRLATSPRPRDFPAYFAWPPTKLSSTAV